jgi:outer membrane protein
MEKNFGSAIKILAIAAAMSASAAVSAQTAGTWSVKAGLNKITPKVESGDMTPSALPGTKMDVGSDTEPIIAASYMVSDNFSVELDLGAPYKHDLIGAGAISGTGKLATVEALPPTIFFQYRFLQAQSKFRPYAGLGLTYAYFQKETGSGAGTALTNPGSPTPTTFKVDAAWGVTPQIGLTYALTDKWFADLCVTKTYLKTTAHYSTGQTIDLKLDPVAVSIAVGYHF